MFRIGDFSRFTRVTVKTLRHYDRLGLLKPAFVDPDTRYRYYAARQIGRLQQILALRNLGLSLEHIAGMIDGKPKGPALAAVLEAKRAEVERQLELDRSRLSQLDARLREIETGTPATFPDVTLRDLPAVRVASRRARVASLDDGVEELFEALEKDAGDAGVRSNGPPLILYHDRDHREQDALVEVAVPVLSSARVAGRSKIRTLAGIPLAACVVYAGSYEQWADVMRGLLSWLQARRLEPAGSIREVFLQFGTRDAEDYQIPHAYLVDNPAAQLTEMQVPVRPRKRRGTGRQARTTATTPRARAPRSPRPPRG